MDSQGYEFHIGKDNVIYLYFIRPPELYSLYDFKLAVMSTGNLLDTIKTFIKPNFYTST